MAPQSIPQKTSPIATIYIPFADYHKDIVEYAFRSASNQTVKCEVVMAASPNTPALLRNQAVNAKSPFIIFLDADDSIAPNFVERCLQTYEQGTYVYTAWREGDKFMHPRECDPYLAHDFDDGRGLIGGYHLITTLFPTALFRELGGFSETLPGMEDTDFYMRAHNKGICGLLCDEPLLTYNGEDITRSKQFRAHENYEDIRRLIYERNGGAEKMGGCCGISAGGLQADVTGQQPGDIAAQVLQPGTHFGRATRRFYDRGRYVGAIVMVAPEDVALMPDVYRAVVTLRELAPTKEMALKAAGLLD